MCYRAAASGSTGALSRRCWTSIIAFPGRSGQPDALRSVIPAHPQVNRHQKRDRLPSKNGLRRSRDPILSWCSAGHFAGALLVLPLRFGEEAWASLPALNSTGGLPDAEDVFTAMTPQGLRLR